MEWWIRSGRAASPERSSVTLTTPATNMKKIGVRGTVSAGDETVW